MVIAHLSDLHLRDEGDAVEFGRRLDRIAARPVDHLVITGDLLDRWQPALLDTALDALASRGLLAALILGFTRAVGEFGATIILAGNIPGRTQTLATAIFSAQQAGREGEANFLLVVALVAGFVAVYATEALSRQRVAAAR